MAIPLVVPVVAAAATALFLIFRKKTPVSSTPAFGTPAASPGAAAAFAAAPRTPSSSSSQSAEDQSIVDAALVQLATARGASIQAAPLVEQARDLINNAPAAVASVARPVQDTFQNIDPATGLNTQTGPDTFDQVEAADPTLADVAAAATVNPVVSALGSLFGS